MLRRALAGLAICGLTATLIVAQAPAPQPPAAPAGRGAGPAEGGRQGGAGGRGATYLPSEEQWAAMSPKAKEYVDKARAIAADDPELQFDFGIFCKASGGAQNNDRATVGVPDSEPKLQPYPAPSPAAVVGGQRLFDNFYWIGNTGIGAWLITSNDGYIMFDTMNSEEDARDIIMPGDEEAEARPDEDQVPGLRAQPLRSHRRRRIHSADDRREGRHASRRLGDLSEEHRPWWRPGAGQRSTRGWRGACAQPRRRRPRRFRR